MQFSVERPYNLQYTVMLVYQHSFKQTFHANEVLQIPAIYIMH
jgi:hypothetical protein